MTTCTTDNATTVGASWCITDEIKASHHYQRLMCSICQDLLQQPIQHSCGQHFCRQCLDRWAFESNDYRCPLCRDPLTQSCIAASAIVLDYLNDIHTSIDYTQKCNNCEYRSNEKEMKLHLINTAYACPNECGKMISTNERYVHLNECNKVKCVNFSCKFVGTINEIKRHLSVCRIHSPTMQQAFPMYSLVRVNLESDNSMTCIVHGYLENKLHVHRLMNGFCESECLFVPFWRVQFRIGQLRGNTLNASTNCLNQRNV
jgi:hypothetical protein